MQNGSLKPRYKGPGAEMQITKTCLPGSGRPDGPRKSPLWTYAARERDTATELLAGASQTCVTDFGACFYIPGAAPTGFHA